VIKLKEARQTRAMCVLLVLQAVVSFRSAPRILETINAVRGPLYQWVPHFTSVINWTLRIGLGLLNAVGPIADSWIAMMDATINVGTKKALVVLRVRLDVLALKGSAIQLADCECIGLRVLEQTNGETIADSLARIFEQAGNPVAVLKDQGADLSRGVTLWKETQRKEESAAIEIIDDIGHALANGLKAQYEKTKGFTDFLKAVSKSAARLRQTSWAFLTPPKIRTKGRFQSIGKLAEWGKNILLVFNQPGRAKKDSALAVVRKALPGFSQRHAVFIHEFAETTQIAHSILKQLKQQGLNQPTYENCKGQADALPEQSAFKKRLLDWLERHRRVQAKLTGQHSLLVSTDILESLFGKFKRIIERSPTADINRMALVIPALCGNKINEQTIGELFSTTCCQDIADWETNNIAYTLRKKRQAFFHKIKKDRVPETG